MFRIAETLYCGPRTNLNIVCLAYRNLKKRERKKALYADCCVILCTT